MGMAIPETGCPKGETVDPAICAAAQMLLSPAICAVAQMLLSPAICAAAQMLLSLPFALSRKCYYRRCIEQPQLI
jgi:hypothetical protein